MNYEFREDKQTIRNFMQKHYSDERLTMLLAHAQDGKLRFYSCCCLAMTPFVNHGLIEGWCDEPGKCGKYEYFQVTVSRAFNRIGWHRSDDADRTRRRILIPMIRAEMKRREVLKSQTFTDESLTKLYV
jgi:hypothetical protein